MCYYCYHGIHRGYVHLFLYYMLESYSANRLSSCKCELNSVFCYCTYTSVIYYYAVYYSNIRRGSKECWIGLYKSEPERYSVTYWLDGNPSTYRNWYSSNWYRDEPDSADQCVRIDDGVFRDISCDSSYRYVCKGIYFFSKAIFFTFLFVSQ